MNSPNGSPRRKARPPGRPPSRPTRSPRALSTCASAEVKDFYTAAFLATRWRSCGGGRSSRPGSSSCVANTPTSTRRPEPALPKPPDSAGSPAVFCCAAAIWTSMTSSLNCGQTTRRHERGRRSRQRMCGLRHLPRRRPCRPFTIKPGEFFSFLGPSGCGKTTILRMVSGFIEPSEGDDPIGGQDMRGIRPNQRPTALIFQNLALFPLMPVWENIAFGLEVRGVDKASAARQGRGIAAAGRPAGRRRQDDQPALRRPEAARRHRPRAGRRAEGHAARRAAVGARPQAAAAHAGRAARHPEAHQRHLHLHHPRPGRGAGHVRPRRRDVARPAATGRPRRRTSTTSRSTASSRRFVGENNIFAGKVGNIASDMAQFETQRRHVPGDGSGRMREAPSVQSSTSGPSMPRLVRRPAMARTRAGRRSATSPSRAISSASRLATRKAACSLRKPATTARAGAGTGREAAHASSTPSMPSSWPTRHAAANAVP